MMLQTFFMGILYTLLILIFQLIYMTLYSEKNLAAWLRNEEKLSLEHALPIWSHNLLVLRVRWFSTSFLLQFMAAFVHDRVYLALYIIFYYDFHRWTSSNIYIKKGCE